MTRGRPLQVYFVALGVLVVLVGAAAGTYVYVQSASDAQHAATADANFAASKAAAQIASGLEIIHGASAAFVGNLSSAEAIFQNPSNCQLGYAPIGAFDTGRIEVVRLDGSVVCSSMGPVAGAVYAGQPWLQSGKQTLTAPLEDPRSHHQVGVIAYPVASLGFLAWFFELTPVGPKLAGEFGTGVDKLEFLVVSSDGKSIVARSLVSSTWVGKPLAGTPFANATDPVDRNDVGGTRRWYGVASVPGTGWKVYVGADAATATAVAARLQQRELGIIVAGVLITFLALVVVYRQVARPMAALSRAVRESRGTDLLVPVTGPTQVATLGEDINALIASLKREGAERETAQRSYADLFEGNPLPSLVLNPKSLQILDANDAAVKALGYARDEFKSLKTSDLVVPDDATQAARIDANRAADAPTLRFGPLGYRKKDGSLLRAVGTSYVVRYGEQKVRVAMLEDVTEKEKIERQMQQAQRLESLGQLAGGVAHDFNNLLTVMLNVTSSLKSKVADKESVRDVDRLDQAAHSASRLTRQLLAFARQELLPLTAVDVGEQLAELKELLARTIGSHVLLTMELDPGVWPVLMDRGQLEQIVINLSVNARDAMPRGGKLVIGAANFTVDDQYAQARAGLRPGRYVRLQVSDSGTGMDKTTLDHAFEPFFTTKPVGQGTGLGLATVYGIVKQLNGHVSIYSEVGRGTTVTVLLPATAEGVAAEAPKPAAEPTPGTGTILVVEDYGDLRELFEEILAGAGYQVLVAADGAQALAQARTHEGSIDILLTDIVMPNMLGTELAQKLLAEHPALRVLFMSGHAQPVIAGASPLPPNATLLQKPFMEAELLEKLSQVLAAPAVDLRG
jgi:PAS domain S-box-containing protein